MPMPLLATWGTLCLGRLWRERANMLHMREAAAKVLVLVILLWIYGNTSSAIKMTHARACRQQQGARGEGGGAAHADCSEGATRGCSCTCSRASIGNTSIVIASLFHPSPLSLATPGSYGLINPLCWSDNLQISGAGRAGVKLNGACARQIADELATTCVRGSQAS